MVLRPPSSLSSVRTLTFFVIRQPCDYSVSTVLPSFTSGTSTSVVPGLAELEPFGLKITLEWDFSFGFEWVRHLGLCPLHHSTFV